MADIRVPTLGESVTEVPVTMPNWVASLRFPWTTYRPPGRAARGPWS